MPLISPEEFKKSRNQQSTSAPKSSGLISPEEFKKQRKQETNQVPASYAQSPGEGFSGIGVPQADIDRLNMQQDIRKSALVPAIDQLTERAEQVKQASLPQLTAPSSGLRSPSEVTDPAARKEIDSFKPYSGTPASAADQFVSSLGNSLFQGIPNKQSGGILEERNNSAAGVTGNVGGEIINFAIGARATKPIADFAIKRGLGNAIGREAATKGIHVSSNVANNLIRGGMAEAGVGLASEVADAVLDTRMNGNESFSERLSNVAQRATIGALADGAVARFGEGIARSLQGMINRRATVTPQAEQAIQEVMKTVEAPSRMKVGNQDTYINKIMTDLKPIVTERMTPPLENPKELAKWVQQGLGDIPLAEVRKLPYEDLRQLAEEIRGGMSMYDVTRQAARERGFNLDDIFAGKTPDVRSKVAQDASRRAYGVYPERVNIARPVKSKYDVERAENDVPKDVFPEPTPADGVKQGWFERLFGEQALGIIPQSMRKGRNTLTTEGQIVDNPLKKTAKGVIGGTKAAARSTYQNLVDMNDPIKRISREAYDASIDAQRANQLANAIVTDKFVTPQGEVVGEGLQGIIRKAGRGNYNAFTDYLVARHALTRMQRGERVYDDKLKMTPEKIAERLQTLERMYPGFKEIGTEWDQYYRNIRQKYGVDEDLIPQELAQALEQQNPNYAPMRRQFSMEEKIKGATFSGNRSVFSGQKAPLKEVSPTGSTRKIVDPVRSTIEQTGAWVNAAMRNRVMKEVVGKLRQDPESLKGIAEIVQPPKGQPNLREVLAKDGEEAFLEMLQEDFNKLFSKQRLDQDNVVRAMIKGEPVYVKVHDPEAVKALMGLGAEQANIALQFMQVLSNTIKRGATGALAPLFAAKSATMDVSQAIIQSENPLTHVGYLFGALGSSIADALRIPGLRNMAQDFYRTGGGYSAALRGERGLKRSTFNMRLDPLLSPRTLAKGAWRTVASPYKVALKVSDIAENMNRIAAYNYKLRKLGERTPENIREAMNYAREITTNYSRRGRQGQTLEALIPYNNAATQGMYRFARAWKKHPVKSSIMLGLTVLMPKYLEYSRFHEDEDYKKLPARERYRNIILSKNEDGTFNKIPMSPEYNAIGALMVDMLSAYKDGDSEAFKGASDALVNAYTPPLVSGMAQGVTQGGGIDQGLAGAANATSVAPIAAVYGNKTFYGAPIDSRKVEDRSPEYRYDERTSKVAKWLGEKMNYSPMKIDYILRAYGGDPARMLLPLTSDVGKGTTRNTLLKSWIVDPVFTNTLTDDFYQGKEMLSQAYRDYQEAGAELPEWYNDGLRQMLTTTRNGSVSKRLTLLNNQKRSVNTDQSLTAEQKSQKLRDIQRDINDIYIEVNSRIREAGVPILSR